ncbi:MULTISPECIES: acetyltransferase [Rhodococcus]|uniref:Acetyltransferase-like protein n=1 Tax=Rhodococcus pyridinivorans AK37 TaxID=1114960 RepID=H0JTT8_9NOCA|nr:MULTISPECIES: acetyltransferase [Rhodococcus]EHK82629.1 acetyltransferase-like protein [Rhodococcus pyridinivorans AK37]MCD2141544.1 putative colanic acid biosynthesis acetyltransferase [Rhodococcus pyridinivorans]TWH37950.1 putative colanic acid biosynthesis acetyltransferase WcaF [Rhodococcus rhodochrous J38]
MSSNSWDLSKFSGVGYDKGRGAAWQILWMAISGAIFMRWWCPAALRVRILRVFGAQVGRNVLIRHRVRIHWPWKLSIGDNSWVGEGAWLLNLEPVEIGSNVCISQNAILCSGSHDRRSPTFEFDNGPIRVGDNTWVAIGATILRGVNIGERVTIGACALVANDIPAGATVVAPVASPK